MTLKVKPLKAFHGDSILISFDDNGTTRNILIDGGTGNTYSKRSKVLKSEIEEIKRRHENIDLLVITHIDDDHIGGIIRMFEYEDENVNLIKRVWFNSGELISSFSKTQIDADRECPLALRSNPDMSVGQGVSLENSLKKLDCWEQAVIHKGKKTIDFYGSEITILSPDEAGLKKLNKKWEKEKGDVELAGDHSDFSIPISQLKDNPFFQDRSVPNRSSISFLFEYQGKRVLFLADAHPSVVTKSIKNLGYHQRNKLEVDLVKVAHHCSRKNTSPELLEIIRCNDYIISTDGKRHGLPDKEAMARIIATNEGKTRLLFNYNIAEKIFLHEDYNKYNFEWKYLDNVEIELV